MNLDEKTVKFVQIFHPGLAEASAAVVEKKDRFVYYTSTETAIKVLANQELWLRNATVMNDYSEISYGLDLIRQVFAGAQGDRFKVAVEEIFPGTIERAVTLLAGWEQDWQLETYISCVSAHDESEDFQGRLSMWRAYGNVALVINNRPMTAITDLLGIYSVPVLYFSANDLEEYFSKITDSILINRSYLRDLGQETLVSYIHNMLFRIAIATKHPGFSEEKEWRIYYRPNERQSPGVSEEIVVLGSIAQKVFKLRLAHEPENGLHFADIPSLLDRLIIGPTEFPYVTKNAFVEVLSKVGVVNASEKVIVSDIPLRTS